jgi:ribosomal protein S21
MPGKSAVGKKRKGSAPRPTQALLQNGAQKATVTVKISRTIRDYITERTIQDESIDRTLRRLLKLTIPVGTFSQRSPRETCDKPPETTTIKVTKEVRDYIVGEAHWNESIDQTLRRLLGFKSNGSVPVRNST